MGSQVCFKVLKRAGGWCPVGNTSCSGELFAMCPVAPGQRNTAVEPAQDSSRFFIIRVQDGAGGRHAFLGLGFEERHIAFDFNVALVSDQNRLGTAVDDLS